MSLQLIHYLIEGLIVDNQIHIVHKYSIHIIFKVVIDILIGIDFFRFIAHLEMMIFRFIVHYYYVSFTLSPIVICSGDALRECLSISFKKQGNGSTPVTIKFLLSTCTKAAIGQLIKSIQVINLSFPDHIQGLKRPLCSAGRPRLSNRKLQFISP